MVLILFTHIKLDFHFKILETEKKKKDKIETQRDPQRLHLFCACQYREIDRSSKMAVTLFSNCSHIYPLTHVALARHQHKEIDETVP